jgi:hypothetical protein
MVMSVEREAMQGRLACLREKKKKLELKIDGNAKYLRQSLNTLLTPVAELEIPLLDEQWDEMKTAWMDLHIVLNDIARLEKELR